MYDSGATDTIVRRQEDAEWAFETLRVMDNHVMEDYSGKATVGQYNLKRVEIFGEGKWRRVEALEVDDVAPTQVVEVAVPDELTGLVGNNVVQQGGEVDLLLGQSHSGMFPVILGQTSGCMERPALAVYQSRLTGKKLLFGKADDYCRAVADPSSRISAAKAVVALNNTDGLTDMQPFRDKSAALLAVPGRVRIGLKFSVLGPEGLWERAVHFLTTTTYVDDATAYCNHNKGIEEQLEGAAGLMGSLKAVERPIDKLRKAFARRASLLKIYQFARHINTPVLMINYE